MKMLNCYSPLPIDMHLDFDDYQLPPDGTPFNGLQIYGSKNMDDILASGDQVVLTLLHHTNNLSPVKDVTFVGTYTIYFEVPLYPTSYWISADNITSTDTDDNYCTVIAYYTDGTTKEFGLERGSRAYSYEEFTKPVSKMVLYASSNHSNSKGDTAAFSNVSIHTGSYGDSWLKEPKPEVQKMELDITNVPFTSIQLDTTYDSENPPYDFANSVYEYVDQKRVYHWEVSDCIDFEKGVYIQRINPETKEILDTFVETPIEENLMSQFKNLTLINIEEEYGTFSYLDFCIKRVSQDGVITYMEPSEPVLYVNMSIKSAQDIFEEGLKSSKFWIPKTEIGKYYKALAMYFGTISADKDFVNSLNPPTCRETELLDILIHDKITEDLKESDYDSSRVEKYIYTLVSLYVNASGISGPDDLVLEEIFENIKSFLDFAKNQNPSNDTEKYWYTASIGMLLMNYLKVSSQLGQSTEEDAKAFLINYPIVKIDHFNTDSERALWMSVALKNMIEETDYVISMIEQMKGQMS